MWEGEAINIEEAIRSALDGDALLFVGAGLSFLAQRENGGTVPDVDVLIDLLLEQPAGTGSKHKLDRVAGSVVRTKGVNFIYDIVRNNFIVDAVDDRLITLYDLPWKRVYTTNYDNAPEISRAGKRPISTATLDDEPSSAELGSIVHINGFVKRVSPHNIESELLLTDKSYATSRLIDTGWLSVLDQDIRSARAVIFAGYSIYDLDIERVLIGEDGLSKKAYFFIAPDADEIEISTLERYGSVIPGGIDVLVQHIKDAAVGYTPPEFATGLTALREIFPVEGEKSKATSVSKLTDQLVYGSLPEQEVLSNEPVFGDQPYIIRREQIDSALEALRLGPWRDVLITGKIASGKSASTLDIASHLRSEGYRVYYAEKGQSLTVDLAKVAKFSDKTAVIFDGYSPFRDEIRGYASRRQLNHRIIVTERSGIHEFIGDFIDTTPNLGPVFEVALDKINHRDVAEFEALTNFGGFWEDRAGSSVKTRQTYISNNLDGSLYRLLLEIIKSKKVQDQIKAILKPLSQDKSASRIFCSAMIVNALRFDFTISEWQYWFDRNSIRRLATAYTEQLRHFISFDVNRIYVRSGLLSLHVLHGFVDNELIRDCLVDLYERAEKSSAENGKWRSLRIELMKFSSIEPMFAGHAKSTFIFDYFDKIRVFGATRNNPDYWLQVGIASTVFDDLPRGETCFKNAYARERAKSSPNLTKIDNYAARFEMKQATDTSDPSAAFDQFISANEKLGRQIFLDINRHYPFKTGRYFSDMASKHYDKWNDKQKERFKLAAISIREKALE